MTALPDLQGPVRHEVTYGTASTLNVHARYRHASNPGLAGDPVDLTGAALTFAVFTEARAFAPAWASPLPLPSTSSADWNVTTPTGGVIATLLRLYRTSAAHPTEVLVVDGPTGQARVALSATSTREALYRGTASFVLDAQLASGAHVRLAAGSLVVKQPGDM